MSEADYASLITAAHNQLHARSFSCGTTEHPPQRHDARLRPGAPGLADGGPAAGQRPELNPVESAWSNMKNSLGNLGSCSTVRQLAAIMKNRLKRMQYRPALIDGFLAQTGLSTQPEPP